MKDVTLNQREQARLQVLNSVVEHQLPTNQAAEVLGISERQVRRVLAACRREGAAAPVHGNRGRQPRNTIPEEVADAVILPASEKYAGFNHSHLNEVLAEREGIDLSRQTVSRLLNRHSLPSARQHRPPKHRVRRERMPQDDCAHGGHQKSIDARDGVPAKGRTPAQLIGPPIGNQYPGGGGLLGNTGQVQNLLGGSLVTGYFPEPPAVAGGRVSPGRRSAETPGLRQGFPAPER